ncbi:helix-turn-helix domain-containing protein [Alkalicoccus saliphilus]|jgi:XRE family transcriptional regulator, master regulator for biofilm formation|uniref:Transcriptional regulator n=1 Tax=Alkalicoccus saliphilus TaxID=200989 RepID=A0A2T4U9T2_9BACI|nr:helix-turn-helix domain-containing protein [Alkalicoccus saliphilus]PTL40140.1 transcriptional regulator [Alkalicoccus saliphilus]
MIGEKVRHYRFSSGMNMTELAKRAGVAKSYISNIERDIQKNPSIQVLEKISEVLDIEVHMLLAETSRETAQESLAVDDEWQSLIIEAMNSGISKDNFKDFISYNRWKMQQN